MTLWSLRIEVVESGRSISNPGEKSYLVKLKLGIYLCLGLMTAVNAVLVPIRFVLTNEFWVFAARNIIAIVYHFTFSILACSAIYRSRKWWNFQQLLDTNSTSSLYESVRWKTISFIITVIGSFIYIISLCAEIYFRFIVAPWRPLGMINFAINSIQMSSGVSSFVVGMVCFNVASFQMIFWGGLMFIVKNMRINNRMVPGFLVGLISCVPLRDLDAFYTTILSPTMAHESRTVTTVPLNSAGTRTDSDYNMHMQLHPKEAVTPEHSRDTLEDEVEPRHMDDVST